MDSQLERNIMIHYLFDLGLSQREMLIVLSYSGHIISQRHLRRILSSHSLWRRKHQSPIEDVIHFVYKELSFSGQRHGYRWMWTKCTENGLNVSRDQVQAILSLLDPSGVEMRLVYASILLQ